MKFRHVFLIFGAVIALAVAAAIARNVIAQNELSRSLPQYERNLETGALMVDGAEYYIISQSNFTPVDMEKEPFGVEKDLSGKRSKDFLHWVNEPGGAWIYMDARIGLAGGLGFVFRRADAEIPTLDEAEIYAVVISSQAHPFPTQAREPHEIALLQGYAASQDLVSFLRESEPVTTEPWAFPEGEFLGSLQLHSGECPRMAFVYTIYRGPDGKINLHENFNHITLNDEFSNLIQEAISP